MRTKLAGSLMVMAVWVAPISRADIVCGAPGVPPGSQVATKVPFKKEVTLSNCYKFVYAGIQAKGNTAGAPGSSGTSGNGGQFHLSAKVTCTQSGTQNQNYGYGGNCNSGGSNNNCNNDNNNNNNCNYSGQGGSCDDDNDGGYCDGNGSSTKTKTGKIEFWNVQDYNKAPLKTIACTPGLVFRANNTPITVALEWSGQGNAHKPTGIFNILGEYQKAPPPPTGSLTFPVGEWMMQTEGPVNPDGTVKIVRE